MRLDHRQQRLAGSRRALVADSQFIVPRKEVAHSHLS
jgi:hypothetical protein